MSTYRIREWGSADWVRLDLSGDDEELLEKMEAALTELLSGAAEHLHVQQTAEGKWEDLE